MKRAAPEGDSAAHERRRKVARTESGEKNSADEDDKVSLTASDNLEDDIEELASPIPAPSAEVTDTDKKEIESILESSEATGENIQPNLADIANKRWGRKMAPDKLKELLIRNTPRLQTARQ